MAIGTCGSTSASHRRLIGLSNARVTLARNVASDTQMSDLVNSRRVTKWSSTHEMGKWSFQARASAMLTSFPCYRCARRGYGWRGGLLTGGHKRCDIDLKLLHARRYH